MATERTAPKLAGFFKMTSLRQRLVGRVQTYRQTTETSGPIITLSPCLIRKSPDAKWEIWESVAFGLSTDLKFKIDRADVGKFMSIEYVDSEPTTKGSPRKVFAVHELTMEEVGDIAEGCDYTHRHELYVSKGADAAFDNPKSEEEDGLPF